MKFTHSILLAAIIVGCLAAFTPYYEHDDNSGGGGNPMIEVAPDWAHWALLERAGKYVSFSRKKIKPRRGGEWVKIYPQKGDTPYDIHVRSDCRSKIVPATPGEIPKWGDS